MSQKRIFTLAVFTLFLLMACDFSSLAPSVSSDEPSDVPTTDPQALIETAVANTMEAQNQMDLAVQQTLTAIAPAATITSSPTPPYAGEWATARSWTLLVSDPFDDNRNNWPTGSDSSASASYTKSIENGKYLVRYLRTENGGLMWNIPGEIQLFDFSRFAVSVDVDLSSPQGLDCAGIILRNSADENYMYTCFFDNGDYRIHEKRDGQWNHLATRNFAGIAPDRPNRLTLVGMDGVYLLYIDGRFVDRVVSDLLIQGKVSLLVGVEANDELTVSFDNFEIRSQPVP